MGGAEEDRAGRACRARFGTWPAENGIAEHPVRRIGRHADPAEPGEIPADAEALSWVPQWAALRQAGPFVARPGAGGSQEGLATPVIAVPQAVDQFGSADMLQAPGVARHVPTAEATAATLRATALTLVGDPEAARRLEAMGAQTAQEGGTRRAAGPIETELPTA